MAAKLNGSNMDITLDGVDHKRVQVIVRDNVATVRSNRPPRRQVASKSGVTSVERPDRKTWRIVFADGTQWAVTRNPDCGCR